MNNYTKKTEDGQEWLIRNGNTRETVWLKDLKKERRADWAETNIGLREPRKGKRSRRRGEMLPADEAPDLCSVATWTGDRDKALRFRSEEEAADLISRWKILQRAKARPEAEAEACS